jgi:hypothetical protein
MSRIPPRPNRIGRQPLPNVTLVVLAKYPQIFEGFVDNAEIYAKYFQKVLVRDGDSVVCPINWNLIQGPDKFSMAGNANMGWRAVPSTNDILYIGDDVRFLQNNTIEGLRNLAYAYKEIGLLSPRIVGGADNPLQTNPPNNGIVYSERHLALICTYIKREVVNTIGYLDDETFVGYGYDDVDYCRRVRNAGYKLAVAPTIAVQHGVLKMSNGETRRGTETFIRNNDGVYDPIQAQCDANALAYKKKWNEQ